MTAAADYEMDWVLPKPVRGMLTVETYCGKCGEKWWSADLPKESPTEFDVYELILRNGCAKCPKGGLNELSRCLNAHTRNMVREQRTNAVSRRAVSALARLFNRGGGYAQRFGRSVKEVAHDRFHAAQESRGERECLLCHSLTGNRSRPMSHLNFNESSLRMFRGVEAHRTRTL